MVLQAKREIYGEKYNLIFKSKDEKLLKMQDELTTDIQHLNKDSPENNNLAVELE